jgi:hypothetical protein
MATQWNVRILDKYIALNRLVISILRCHCLHTRRAPPARASPYTVQTTRKQDTITAELHCQTDGGLSPATRLGSVNVTTVLEQKLSCMCEIVTSFEMYEDGGSPEFRITKRIQRKE